MLARTHWRVLEEPCPPEEAMGRWEAARQGGADGAVTSWGSGIQGRETIRLFWEIRPGARVPEGEDLVEENWTPYWRKSLARVSVTERVVLIPAWDEVPGAADADCALRIDPGMAFGAGDHPTTRVCLRVLEELGRRGELPQRVLDVGTGTGVLALAAAHFGAERADALDIDPFGYAACRRNARLNGLEGAVHPVLLSLDLLEGTYPLILANIVAPQLGILAELLRRRLEPGGRLVLSGFEAGQAAAVAAVLGLPVEDRREEQGWATVTLRAEERR
jgi:ribosomal protein L11 methyltransferase